jgi:excisionase family DNA binding protein
MPDGETLSLTEAADVLGIEVEEVLDLVFRRELGVSARPKSRIRIPRSALDEYKRRTTHSSAG